MQGRVEEMLGTDGGEAQPTPSSLSGAFNTLAAELMGMADSLGAETPEPPITTSGDGDTVEGRVRVMICGVEYLVDVVELLRTEVVTLQKRLDTIKELL